MDSFEVIFPYILYKTDGLQLMQIPFLNRFLTIAVGLIYGVTYAAGSFQVDEAFKNSYLLNEGVAIACFLPILLYLIQRVQNEYFLPIFVDQKRHVNFYQQEKFSYLIFLIPVFVGVKQQFALVWGLIFVLLLLQVGLLLINAKPAVRKGMGASQTYIAFLFLISGFSALIYQVIWQRILFTTFGINSEAVTVIVSIFMFGLGIGALVGGYVQRKFNNYLLHIFIGIEVCIAVFGLLSVYFIQLVSKCVTQESTLELTAWVYLILSFPTLLMGAGLPILVAYLQKYFNNIGKTVGLLYALNTLGSAIAAFFTVEVLFVFLGQSSVLIVAAFFNCVTALLIFYSGRSLTTPVKEDLIKSNAVDAVDGNSISFKFAFICLIAIGYISLSQEILWFRLLGILTGGKPQVFGLLLCAFLLGIAGGSIKAKKNCEDSTNSFDNIVIAIFLATLIFYLAAPSVSFVTALINKPAGVLLCYILICMLGYCLGGLLPIFIHKAINKRYQDSTAAMSWLYFANIVGATGGPLFTGFVLLEFYTLEINILILTCLSVLLLLCLILFMPASSTTKRKNLFVISVVFILGVFFHKVLYYQYMEKIQLASFGTPKFKDKVENRAGVITVERNTTDVIYGGGVYDGHFNVNPLFDSNLITRAYMIAGLHAKPERVLEIGLSSGSWTRVMMSYENIKSISVVEINPGYKDIIKNYSEIAQILKSPKVSIYIDDGRRWLRNHPNEKFDLIVMNTTLYWRNNATNLLSKEFLEICKSHLREGGVLYYNNTGSDDVTFTAAQVFSHVSTYQNFVVASDVSFRLAQTERRQNFLKFKNGEGKPIFSQPEYSEILERFINYSFSDWKTKINPNKKLQIITDDNMAVEYKQREVIF